ncbi:MAG: response regulator [Acidimicrobiia bacterium]|nr:response regulator [Acidimicrobiia bacterium]
MIDLSELRILLVEDNPLDRRMMLRHLADHDLTHFEVTAADDLNAALTALETAVFDCVLLDLSLPDSEGLASVDAILNQAPKCPIVVLSGLEDPAVAVQAVERGAQDYLTKRRVDAELVGRSIRHAIARQHGETQLRFARERLEMMEERERIARDLHDTVIQQLFATGMGLQATLPRVTEPEIRTRLDEAIDGIDDGIRQLREAVFGLHKPPPAMTLSDEIVAVAEGQEAALGFTPSIRIGPAVDEVSEEIGHDLLSTLREGLSNVAKHADATAVQIVVEVEGAEVVLRLIDNGVGLSGGTGRSVAEGLTGRGLRNMRLRALALDGHFTVGTGPGGGTELIWRAKVGNE